MWISSFDVVGRYELERVLVYRFWFPSLTYFYEFVPSYQFHWYSWVCDFCFQKHWHELAIFLQFRKYSNKEIRGWLYDLSGCQFHINNHKSSITIILIICKIFVVFSLQDFIAHYGMDLHVHLLRWMLSHKICLWCSWEEIVKYSSLVGNSIILGTCLAAWCSSIFLIISTFVLLFSLLNICVVHYAYIMDFITSKLSLHFMITFQWNSSF